MGKGEKEKTKKVMPSGIYMVEAITENGRRSVQKVVVE